VRYNGYMGKICLNCNLWFQHIRKKSKFCSLKCYHNSPDSTVGKFKKGHSSLRDQKGAKNSMWKGDNVGYSALHKWIKKQLFKRKVCQHCGTKKAKRYEWANISKKYKRDLEDWIELCCSCHYKFDRT